MTYKTSLFLFLFLAYCKIMDAQNASGTVTFTSDGGHKVPITSLFSQLNVENPLDYNILGTVNDGSSPFNVTSLGVEDYFVNTSNGTHVVNNSGDPTIFFNGTDKTKASAELYNMQGQFLGNLPVTNVDNSTLQTYTDFQGLNPGMYLIRLNNELGSKTVKVINDNSSDWSSIYFT